VVAIALMSLRIGAVGFIDWLDESTHFLRATAPYETDEQSCSGSGKKTKEQIRNGEPRNSPAWILQGKLIGESSGVPGTKYQQADAHGNTQQQRENNSAPTDKTDEAANCGKTENLGPKLR
jgi:hypothetical protein